MFTNRNTINHLAWTIGNGDHMHEVCDTSRMRTAKVKQEVVVVVVVIIQALYGSITTRQKYKGTSSMNCRELGSHARGVYLTQYTSSMETARVREEEGADRSVIARE